LTPEADISEVMGAIQDVLDESIATEGYLIREPPAAYDTGGPVDLSRIDFEALQQRFRQGRKRTEAEKLRGAIGGKLRQMVRLNRTRTDYLEKFQKLIDEYNAGAMDVDLLFAKLLAFTAELNAEEQRGIAEHLTEEELAVFDLLTRPELNLTPQEREAVKQVAHDLLATLKNEKLVLDWRKRQVSRAQVLVTIRDVLDRGLPDAFSQELYEQKCDILYQHIYDSYYGQGRSVYEAAA
ncbi:MAG TPA: type I restriction enzyme endonuclease domain-containing protein, partial [Herpetosiphonaceae bacterium]|nr:type I restriction enzyme endonuclease domain-containing protein [Herpetosiphonaceae bacterium]